MVDGPVRIDGFHFLERGHCVLMIPRLLQEKPVIVQSRDEIFFLQLLGLPGPDPDSGAIELVFFPIFIAISPLRFPDNLPGFEPDQHGITEGTVLFFHAYGQCVCPRPRESRAVKDFFIFGVFRLTPGD